MGNVKIGNIEVGLGDLLLFIGGLLMIISIFFAWDKYLPALGNDTTVTGMNIISGKFVGNGEWTYAFMGKAPLFMLIFGIIALILAALPLFKVDVPALKIVGGVVALVGLVFAILFLTVGNKADLFSGDSYNAAKALLLVGSFKIQFGAYFALIASIVATVGGVINVIPMFKK
ncbi:MAG: hypothetical protein J6U42_01555 [Lachnospiraceae bacterium]|nr:hypothetical protein [Lachnospiraceae bacterium]